jgi:hypothetical protein
MTDTSVTLAAMKPNDAEQLARSSHSRAAIGILALAIPLTLFIALRWLHEPKFPFRQVSIVSQSPDEPAVTLARMAREESALIRRAHVEIIALTLFALTLLYFLLNQTGVPQIDEIPGNNVCARERRRMLVAMVTVARSQLHS